MKANSKIILRTDQVKKDGTCGLYLRITINRKKKDISLKTFINPKNWNKDKGKVVGRITTGNTERLNMILTNQLSKVNNILYNIEIKEIPLTFDNFMNFYNGTVEMDYFEFVEKEIKLLEKSYSWQTIKKFKTELTKLKKFKSKLPLQSIDYKFLKEYEFYMRDTLNNHTNTIHKTMGIIRTFVNRAKKEGLIDEYPFDKYKLKLEKTNREYLTQKELNTLFDLYNFNLKPHLKNVLEYFLFACYTGLRYQDIQNLKFKNIQEGKINIKMNKTKEVILIPLNDKASLLMPDFTNTEDKIFNVYSNQKTNEYLKEIIKFVGINKSISFHCSRHTFATISLTIGIPIEVVSKLLGHNTLKTTQIYAKIVDTVKVKEMEKWNLI